MNKVTFTKSKDGNMRATFRIEHRLSITDMADIFAHRMQRNSTLSSLKEETESIVRQAKEMPKPTILKTIQTELGSYGEDEIQTYLSDNRLNGMALEVWKVFRQRFKREVEAGR